MLNIDVILAGMGRERKRYTRAELAVRTVGIAVMAGALAFLACLSLLATWNIFWRSETAKNDALAAQKDLELVIDQNNHAKIEVTRLSSPTGFEAALRQRFGVVSVGEGVIVLANTPATSSTSTNQSGGFWSQLWNSVFN